MPLEFMEIMLLKRANYHLPFEMVVMNVNVQYCSVGVGTFFGKYCKISFM